MRCSCLVCGFASWFSDFQTKGLHKRRRFFFLPILALHLVLIHTVSLASWSRKDSSMKTVGGKKSGRQSGQGENERKSEREYVYSGKRRRLILLDGFGWRDFLLPEHGLYPRASLSTFCDVPPCQLTAPFNKGHVRPARVWQSWFDCLSRSSSALARCRFLGANVAQPVSVSGKEATGARRRLG